MSFREKSAWITFVTVLLVAIAYLGGWQIGALGPRNALGFFIGCIVALILLQVTLHIAAALTTPPHARGPKDERELNIQLKSFRVGYYVLVAGVLLMIFSGHMTSHVHQLMFNALLALVISTLSISLTQIVLFITSR